MDFRGVFLCSVPSEAWVIVVCPLVLQKLVLCVPSLHGWQGSWGQQIQEFARRGHEAMLVQGHSEAPGQSSGAGRISSARDQKNWDSQHMLNQPRVSFPRRLKNYQYQY